MRALLVLGLSILLLGSGCSDKEGILITTSSDMREPIYSLSFFVGADVVASDDYFTQAKEIEDVVVEGRDLATDPFKLFLTPPTSPEEAKRLVSEDIFVGVVAYDVEHKVVGYGFSDTLVFASGKVLEWEVSIRALERGEGAGFVETGDCLKWRIGPNRWIHIGGETDQDCDGASTTGADPDCDDTNPDIYPDAEERCDNGFDDNCNLMIDGDEDADGDSYSPCASPEEAADCDDNDGTVYPMLRQLCDTTVLTCEEEGFPPSDAGDRCFVTAMGQCFRGIRECLDGSETFCNIDAGELALVEQCDAYEDCDAPNPLSCVPNFTPLMGSCVINYHQIEGTEDICIAPNGNDTAEVQIPFGPIGCDTYELRNANAQMRWDFTIEYGTVGGPCDDASLRVKVRNVLLPAAPTPLYIDARDESGILLGYFKLDIASMAIGGDCKAASLSCGDSNNGPWVPIAVPQN